MIKNENTTINQCGCAYGHWQKCHYFFISETLDLVLIYSHIGFDNIHLCLLLAFHTFWVESPTFSVAMERPVPALDWALVYPHLHHLCLCLSFFPILLVQFLLFFSSFFLQLFLLDSFWDLRDRFSCEKPKDRATWNRLQFSSFSIHSDNPLIEQPPQILTSLSSHLI